MIRDRHWRIETWKKVLACLYEEKASTFLWKAIPALPSGVKPVKVGKFLLWPVVRIAALLNGDSAE